MNRKQARKKHLRRVAGPIWFWLAVSRNSVRLYPNPSSRPPLLEPTGVAVVGFQDADEQERAYRYFLAHRQYGLQGFIHRYAKRISHREVVVVEPDHIISFRG